MACLRSFSRRSLYPKWFSCKISRPEALLHRYFKDHSEASFPDSSLLIRRFHRHVFSEDRKKTAFGSTSESSSGVLLCRHMSSKPEDWYSKIDAFENVVEEVVSEKTVEAIATNVSTAATENFVAYVINGIHELTGFNWWISIVLTAFLVNVLMSPVSVQVHRRALELQILWKAHSKVHRQEKASDDLVNVLECTRRKLVLALKALEIYLYFVAFFVPDAIIYAFFMDGIGIMAKKIPELSISDSLYILPLVTGFTFWLASEINKSGSNLAFRMMRLPLFLIIFIALQDIFQFKPAVYFFVIPSRIYISTLFLMLRTNRIVKTRSILGWPDVPVTNVSEHQRIMARLINLISDVVKKKDKK